MEVSINMRVLYCAPIPKIRFSGGITHIAEEILGHRQALEVKGASLTFFNIERVLRGNQGMGRLTPVNFLNMLKLGWDLRREVRSGRYDLIHYQSSLGLALLKDLFCLAFAKRGATGRILLHIHFIEINTILTRNPLIRKMIVGMINRHIHSLVLLSPRFAKTVREASIDRPAIFVLENFQGTFPVPIERKPVTGKIREILFLGSICRRKGVDNLLEAVAGIPSEVGLRLTIAGTFLSAEDERRITRFVREKDLQGRVFFAGYLKDEEKRRALMEAEIVVLPSYEEGTPVVLYEAMAAGSAIVATDVGGIPDVVENGVNGYLITPGDIPALRSAIESLLTDENRRTLFQRANTERAAEHCTDWYLQKMISLYQKIMTAAANEV